MWMKQNKNNWEVFRGIFRLQKQKALNGMEKKKNKNKQCANSIAMNIQLNCFLNILFD